MMMSSFRGLAAATLTLALAVAVAPLPAAAHMGDVAPATKKVIETTPASPDAGLEMARRGRGADDGPGHVRGGGKKRGRGADDGPNHT